jgi:hypothetical protein
MSSQKNIQDELRSLGSGLPVHDNQPFSVPDGYFEGLAATILAKVKSSESAVQAELNDLSPMLAGISKQMPYAVPAFYFEKNVEELTAITGETDSSILAPIGKTTPYTVPEGYFSALPEVVLSKVTKTQAKVVPLFARTWMRVASAAVIAGALFFGGYQLLTNSTENNAAVTASQPAAKEQNLVANNTKPIEKEMNQVSTKELEEFIETVRVKPAKAADKENKTADKEVEKLLEDVSTSEMESFLSALPTADDEFLITD